MHLADLTVLSRSACRGSGSFIATPKAWARTAILNVASSGKFSSDRTIAQYASKLEGGALSGGRDCQFCPQQRGLGLLVQFARCLGLRCQLFFRNLGGQHIQGLIPDAGPASSWNGHPERNLFSSVQGSPWKAKMIWRSRVFASLFVTYGLPPVPRRVDSRQFAGFALCGLRSRTKAAAFSPLVTCRARSTRSSRFMASKALLERLS